MNQIGQISNSNKSEMSNWAKQYSYQLTAEQIQAVENNDCSKFKTTSGGKETMSQIWKETPFGGCFGQKYAESYDEASWFRARCAFLEYRNSELAREEDSEDSDDDKMICERCAREEKEGEEFKDYGGDYMCPECITEMEDSCDCCVKGWSKANEFGRCTCRCACRNLLRNCRYECKEWAEECAKAQ